jgi:REP element-mobilizing transposase RayT
MTRKPETIAFWRGRLPHWEVADGRYFVTIHLAGAIPLQGQKRVQAIADELRKAPRQTEERRLQVQRRIFAEMELWLDRAEHVDHLRRSDVAEMIVEAIAFREGRDWHMFEFVVMPSHIHLFFEISGNSSHGTNPSRLKTIVEQFKRWTGHEAARLLSIDKTRFWQDEWFDHWSRSDEEDEQICVYIRRNPEKAQLVQNHVDWPFGSWSTPK